MKNTLIAFILLSSVQTKSQLFTSLGAGVTNQYLSVELQAGARVHNTTVAVGYIAMPDASQPALFNIRAGQTISNRGHVYVGYVFIHKSNHYRYMNSKSWQVGGQYHFMHYDKGTFFVSASYTPGYPSAIVGMSYNLFKE